MSLLYFSGAAFTESCNRYWGFQ